ncbi:hypothetical protein ACSQ67_009998 [Phaseolus vulgaris]
MAFKTYASAIAAAAASAALLNPSNAYADGISPPNSSENQPSPAPPKVRNDHPRTTSAGFDPEALERGVKALKEISTSPHGKKVFETIKKQEETKQAELAAKVAEFRQMKALHETCVLRAHWRVPGMPITRGAVTTAIICHIPERNGGTV